MSKLKIFAALAVCCILAACGASQRAHVDDVAFVPAVYQAPPKTVVADVTIVDIDRCKDAVLATPDYHLTERKARHLQVDPTYAYDGMTITVDNHGVWGGCSKALQAQALANAQPDPKDVAIARLTFRNEQLRQLAYHQQVKVGDDGKVITDRAGRPQLQLVAYQADVQTANAETQKRPTWLFTGLMILIAGALAGGITYAVTRRRAAPAQPAPAPRAAAAT